MSAGRQGLPTLHRRDLRQTLRDDKPGERRIGIASSECCPRGTLSMLLICVPSVVRILFSPPILLSLLSSTPRYHPLFAALKKDAGSVSSWNDIVLKEAVTKMQSPIPFNEARRVRQVAVTRTSLAFHTAAARAFTPAARPPGPPNIPSAQRSIAAPAHYRTGRDYILGDFAECE